MRAAIVVLLFVVMAATCRGVIVVTEEVYERSPQAVVDPTGSS